jgi:hypothetical protein
LRDEIGATGGACPGAYEHYPDGGVWYIREGRDPLPEIPVCLLCGQRHMKPGDREPHVILEVVVSSREEAKRYTEAETAYESSSTKERNLSDRGAIGDTAEASGEV